MTIFESSSIFKWDPFSFSHYLFFIIVFDVLLNVVVVVVSLFIFGYGELNNGPCKVRTLALKTPKTYIAVDRERQRARARASDQKNYTQSMKEICGVRVGEEKRGEVAREYICHASSLIESLLYCPSLFHLYARQFECYTILKIDRFKLHGDGGKLTTKKKPQRNALNGRVCKLR